MKKKRTPNRHYLFIFILAFILLEAVLFYSANHRAELAEEEHQQKLEVLQNSLDAVPVLAKAVSVYDATANEKLYGKGDDTPMPLASLAKIMTITTALERHSSDDLISISKDSLSQSGDYGLYLGEKWNVIDLAKLTLIESANDGAYALSGGDPAFMKDMEAKARRIGADQSSFLTPTGLDITNADGSVKASAFASAEGVNQMAVFALREYPDVFGVTVLPAITLTSESGFTHTFKNTDTIVSKIPNLLFSKTGYTNTAGGNLCIIFVNAAGHEIAVTVLGSTFDGRFDDMENLVKVLYDK
ncbi:MAG TPA: hypothetical protein VG694_00795 [Candidatus Paceibacterota bacterium]|nr:hypothetical protein [Candidatus Paceibacterota bacterium]